MQIGGRTQKELDMANQDHVELVKQGAKAVENWREENKGNDLRLDLQNADFSGLTFKGIDFNRSRIDHAKFNDATLVGCSFKNRSMASMEFVEAVLIDVDLANAIIVNTKFNQAKLRKVSFHETTLRNVDLSNATLIAPIFNSTTKIENCTWFETSVDRYTKEYLIHYLSQGQLMDLDVNDDLAKLKSRFSGIWMWSHVIALILFSLPYLWFVASQWSLSFMSEGVESLEKSITLLEAIARYIWNGGENWKSGWNLNFLSFSSFCGFLIYNTFRFILLWKTKTLETEEAVSGLPVKFSLTGFWSNLFNWTTKIFPWIAVPLLLYNTWHFLMRPVLI